MNYSDISEAEDIPDNSFNSSRAFKLIENACEEAELYLNLGIEEYLNLRLAEVSNQDANGSPQRISAPKASTPVRPVAQAFTLKAPHYNLENFGSPRKLFHNESCSSMPQLSPQGVLETSMTEELLTSGEQANEGADMLIDHYIACMKNENHDPGNDSEFDAFLEGILGDK